MLRGPMGACVRGTRSAWHRLLALGAGLLAGDLPGAGDGLLTGDLPGAGEGLLAGAMLAAAPDAELAVRPAGPVGATRWCAVERTGNVRATVR